MHVKSAETSTASGETTVASGTTTDATEVAPEHGTGAKGDDVAEYISDMAFELYQLAERSGLASLGLLLKATSEVARKRD